MKVLLTDNYIKRLNRQIQYIAEDKALAARNFKAELSKRIVELQKFPFKHRESIFYPSKENRDLVYKGYVIVYNVDSINQTITIITIIKHVDY